MPALFHGLCPFLILVSKDNNRKMTESEVSAKQEQPGAAHTQDLAL